MEIKHNTVTIDLETYEAMKEEIKSLKKEVQQKTIYRDVLHPIYGQIVVVILLIVIVYDMFR